MKKLFLLAAAVGATVANAQQFTDDFNRADAADLGANYDIVTGTSATRTIGNEAGNVAGSTGITLVKSSVLSGAYNMQVVKADIRVTDTTSALTYCALILGADGTTLSNHGAYVKLQRQVAGGFSHIGIYTGNNSSNTGITTAGGAFQVIATPFMAARVTLMTTSLTNLYTGIDTNFDNVDDITYNSTLVFPTLTMGNRMGLHVFGATGRMDNYLAAVPEPATMAALGLGVAALLRRRRK